MNVSLRGKEVVVGVIGLGYVGEAAASLGKPVISLI